MSIRIVGTGSYVPERVVTNDDMAKIVETNDEWIRQRVGVEERRVCTAESAADMAIKAAKRAIEAAGISPERIGLIIAATITSDTICPTVAGWVQKAIGAKCPAFDLNSACSGFLFSLDTAAAIIARGGIEYALVIGAERMSRIVNWQDRSTCVIFGDGAGAAVVAPGENYLASHLYTQGGDTTIIISAGKGASPFYEPEDSIPPAYVVMKGQETFKFAVRRLEEDVRTVCNQVGIPVEKLDFVVPHQANLRIIDLAARRLGLPLEKFYVNLQHYGNTSAASVAITLDELARSGKLKEGDLIALCAFGGGLSSAACIIKW